MSTYNTVQDVLRDLTGEDAVLRDARALLEDAVDEGIISGSTSLGALLMTVPKLLERLGGSHPNARAAMRSYLTSVPHQAIVNALIWASPAEVRATSRKRRASHQPSEDDEDEDECKEEHDEEEEEEDDVDDEEEDDVEEEEEEEDDIDDEDEDEDVEDDASESSCDDRRRHRCRAEATADLAKAEGTALSMVLGSMETTKIMVFAGTLASVFVTLGVGIMVLFAVHHVGVSDESLTVPYSRRN